MTIRKLLFVTAVLFASLTIAGPAKAQTCNYYTGTLTSAPGEGTSHVASVTLSAPSTENCTHVQITFFNATLRDAGDTSCNPNFTITGGGTFNLWNEYLHTDNVYHSVDRVSVAPGLIQAPSGLNTIYWTALFDTQSVTLAFNGNCTDGVESINVGFAYLP